MHKKLGLLGGVLLLFLLQCSVLLIVLPQLLNLQVISIEDSDMTPTYSRNGVLFIQTAAASELLVGDIVTYYVGSGETVQTRRIVAVEEELFYVKGDAQETIEPVPVHYRKVIGTPRFYLPLIGAILSKNIFDMFLYIAMISLVLANIVNSIYTKRQRKKRKKRISPAPDSTAEETIDNIKELA